jgi:hypothetical protein
MRAIRQSLSGRSLTRLEVVVPSDLAVTVLNARHRELAALEERYDCRIVFSADAHMKARDFRLLPTVRKGDRRERAEKPVRPSLLAPLMVEQAKALALVKEVAAMKPEEIERELEEGVQAPVQPPQPVLVQAPVMRTTTTLWEDAAVLRRLLFSPNVAIATVVVPPASSVRTSPDLARANAVARVPRHSRGRRRR